MLAHYGIVRQSRIDGEKAKLKDTSFKVKFIGMVLDGSLKIMKVPEETIRKKLVEENIPFKYYENSKSRDFSKESLEKHMESYKECEARLGCGRENGT